MKRIIGHEVYYKIPKNENYNLQVKRSSAKNSKRDGPRRKIYRIAHNGTEK